LKIFQSQNFVNMSESKKITHVAKKSGEDTTGVRGQDVVSPSAPPGSIQPRSASALRPDDTADATNFSALSLAAPLGLPRVYQQVVDRMLGVNPEVLNRVSREDLVAIIDATWFVDAGRTSLPIPAARLPNVRSVQAKGEGVAAASARKSDVRPTPASAAASKKRARDPKGPVKKSASPKKQVASSASPQKESKTKTKSAMSVDSSRDAPSPASLLASASGEKAIKPIPNQTKPAIPSANPPSPRKKTSEERLRTIQKKIEKSLLSAPPFPDRTAVKTFGEFYGHTPEKLTRFLTEVVPAEVQLGWVPSLGKSYLALSNYACWLTGREHMTWDQLLAEVGGWLLMDDEADNVHDYEYRVHKTANIYAGKHPTIGVPHTAVLYDQPLLSRQELIQLLREGLGPMKIQKLLGVGGIPAKFWPPMVTIAKVGTGKGKDLWIKALFQFRHIDVDGNREFYNPKEGRTSFSASGRGTVYLTRQETRRDGVFLLGVSELKHCVVRPDLTCLLLPEKKEPTEGEERCSTPPGSSPAQSPRTPERASAGEGAATNAAVQSSAPGHRSNSPAKLVGKAEPARVP
jgi:hypothetical protein